PLAVTVFRATLLVGGDTDPIGVWARHELCLKARSFMETPMTRPLLILAVAVFVGGPAGAGGKVDEEGEVERFEGTWRSVSSESNGKPAPKDVATGLLITFKGDGFAMREVGKDMVLKGTMKVDPSKTPKKFDWTAEVLGKKRTTIGIY